MDKGVLIFAINSTFDYVSAAEVAARRAKKYLNLPVTLITNSPVESTAFDSVVVIDDNASTLRNVITPTGTSVVQWFNESRVLAYELSPYDRTLLIDADFFMFNDSLAPIFDSNSEIACYSEINDVTGTYQSQMRLSEISIPMQWATVLYFKKCPLAKAVFDFMKIVRTEWKYYSILYHFRNHNFRNDFALSIALQALTGYSTSNFNRLPGKLNTLFSDVDVLLTTENEVVFTKNSKVHKITGMNVHCMNKLAMEKFYA